LRAIATILQPSQIIKQFIGLFAIALAATGFADVNCMAAQWNVPLGGNTFRIEPKPGGDSLGRDGILRWSDTQDVFAVYFHVDQPAELSLSLRSKTVDGSAKLSVNVRAAPQSNIASEQSPTTLVDSLRSVELRGAEPATHSIGKFRADQAGYIEVRLQGLSRDGTEFVQLSDLVVSSETPGLKVDFVRDNEGNMFYWGRRGPSVHLGYELPPDNPWIYAYSELTVPEGQDPIGSYFMANGFAEGYFGIQVNSETERRVLFSVWSPFHTDNPRDIPLDQRVELVAKGAQTRTGEFGNEGSGGQSFLVYPWRSGKTYRFLTEVQPQADNYTRYTCWFSEVSTEWQLVASFRRPKTNTTLKGFHSFLENFDPSRGHLSRRCNYANIWVGNQQGEWKACSTARFTVDATGSARHRLDFAGGTTGGIFFLQNCGFFSGTVNKGTKFQLDQTSDRRPDVDISSLPR
jgi:Domain of unknown function (DUF3472)/Domain of unknown function (DUF5077)